MDVPKNAKLICAVLRVIADYGYELRWEKSMNPEWVKYGTADDTLGMSDVDGGVICVRTDLDQSTTGAVLIHELAHQCLHSPKAIGFAAWLMTDIIKEMEVETVVDLVFDKLGLQFNNDSNRHLSVRDPENPAMVGAPRKARKMLGARIESVANEIAGRISSYMEDEKNIPVAA